MQHIDQIHLNFDPNSILILNLVIAFIMFGVALDIHLSDFKQVSKTPKPLIIGLVCQFLILPAIAYSLTRIFTPLPSVSLGIILLASCPGGNLSNFLTSFSKGNTALSVSMSSIATMLSVVMTPFNLSFWGGMNPETATLLEQVDITALDVFITVLKILIIPTILGVLVAKKFPVFTHKLKNTFSILSFVIFSIFLLIALIMNYDNFMNYIGHSFFIVLITNTLALALGYYAAKLLKSSKRDCKAISFEVGIQNAGFGLILIFNFFNGLGGMAVVVGWWGIWHMLSGLTLAMIWSRKAKN